MTPTQIKLKFVTSWMLFHHAFSTLLPFHPFGTTLLWCCLFVISVVGIITTTPLMKHTLNLSSLFHHNFPIISRLFCHSFDTLIFFCLFHVSILLFQVYFTKIFYHSVTPFQPYCTFFRYSFTIFLTHSYYFIFNKFSLNYLITFSLIHISSDNIY